MQSFPLSADLVCPGTIAVLSLPLWRRGQDHAAEFVTEMHGRITGLTGRQGFPALLNSVRLAHLQAISLLATSVENLRDHLCAADAMHRARLVAELQQRSSIEIAAVEQIAQPQDWRAPAEESVVLNEGALDLPPADPAALREIITSIAIDDLRLMLGSDALPQSAQQAFVGLENGQLGFFEGFVIYFAWQLKTVDNLRRALLGGKVASLDAMRLTPATLLSELYDTCAQMGARFDRYLQYPINAEQAQAVLPGWDKLWWLRPLSAHAAETAQRIAAQNDVPMSIFQPTLDWLAANRSTPASVEAAIDKTWASYHDALTFLDNGTYVDQACSGALQEAAFHLRQGNPGAALQRLAEAETLRRERRDGANLSPRDRRESLKSLATGMAWLHGLQGEDKLASQAFVKALGYVPRENTQEWINLAIAVIHAVAGNCNRAEKPADFNPVDEAASILLAQIPRTKDPIGWALLKAAHAAAIASAAALKRWPGKLEAACSAFKEALEALPADAHPALRSRLKFDIATAQADCALIKKDMARIRTAKEELAEAFEESRTQLTQPEVAECLSKLGLLHAELAVTSRDEQLAEQAGALIQEAIEIAESQGLWLKWPVFQGHRADILLRCAEWRSEGNWSEAAVLAYETALQLCPSETAVPLLMGLGDAHFASSSRASDSTEPARLAALVYELAEEEAGKNGSASAIRVQLVRKRGMALMLLARTAKRPKLFQAADDAFRLALSLCEEVSQPLVRAALQHDLAACLAGEGETDQNVMLLRDAASIFERALEVRTSSAYPGLYAQTAGALGEVLRKIAVMTTDPAPAREAIRLQEAALAAAKRAGDKAAVEQVENLASAARNTHNDLEIQKHEPAGNSQKSARA